MDDFFIFVKNMRYFFLSIFLIYSVNSFSQGRVELEKKRNATLKEISETENLLEKIKHNKTAYARKC